MKKKIVSKEPITEEGLKKVLKDYPTKNEMDQGFDKLDRKFEERFVQFKSDIFTRFDQVMGELSQMREDRVFETYDVKNFKSTAEDHEERIKKLETS